MIQRYFCNSEFLTEPSKQARKLQHDNEGGKNHGGNKKKNLIEIHQSKEENEEDVEVEQGCNPCYHEHWSNVAHEWPHQNVFHGLPWQLIQHGSRLSFGGRLFSVHLLFSFHLLKWLPAANGASSQSLQQLKKGLKHGTTAEEQLLQFPT